MTNVHNLFETVDYIMGMTVSINKNLCINVYISIDIYIIMNIMSRDFMNFQSSPQMMLVQLIAVSILW